MGKYNSTNAFDVKVVSNGKGFSGFVKMSRSGKGSDSIDNALIEVTSGKVLKFGSPFFYGSEQEFKDKISTNPGDLFVGRTPDKVSGNHNMTKEYHIIPFSEIPLSDGRRYVLDYLINEVTSFLPNNLTDFERLVANSSFEVMRSLSVRLFPFPEKLLKLAVANGEYFSLQRKYNKVNI